MKRKKKDYGGSQNSCSINVTLPRDILIIVSILYLEQTQTLVYSLGGKSVSVVSRKPSRALLPQDQTATFVFLPLS